MGILDEIKDFFSEASKRPRAKSAADQVESRRTKFIKSLQVQKTALKKYKPGSKLPGKGRDTRPFWYDESRQAFVFEPRYGRKPVEVIPGKPHLIAPSKEKLAEVIDEVIDATKKYELDAVLEQAARKDARTSVAASSKRSRSQSSTKKDDKKEGSA